MIDYDIRKKLDNYVEQLRLSTNSNFRRQVRAELVDFVEGIEKDKAIRGDYLAYVFTRSNNGGK